MDRDPDQRAIDLAECEREPIHIPGAIQGHGALLIAEQAAPHTILQISANLEALLGCPSVAVLGTELVATVVEAAGAGSGLEAKLREAIATATPSACQAAHVELGGRRWDTLVHADQGLVFVELEPAVELDAAALLAEQAEVRALMGEILAADARADLHAALPGPLRRLLGYERVLVYLFDDCGAGEVVAEDKVPELEPYLGLRFPASDIPAQARRLYVVERARLIVDAGADPVAIVPPLRPDTGEPVDLGHAALRSVSPIHRAYLGNMGVRGSMSISLVDDDRLFGLIACHHRRRHQPAYAVRTDAACLGAVAAYADRALARDQSTRALVEGGRVVRRLVAAIDRREPPDGRFPDVLGGLVGLGPDVLAVVEASGALVRYRGELATLGRVPPRPLLDGLADHCSANLVEGVYATDHLEAAYPPAAEHRDTAAGVLAVGIDASGGLVAWLRPELMRTVNWGGDPRRAIVRGVHGELSPRRSFALWCEEVEGHAQRFRRWELSLAAHLRHQLVDMVLRHAAELERLNLELEAAVDARDEFMSIASHELKTPLSTLLLAIEALELGLRGEPEPEPGASASPRVERRLELARRQIERLDRLVMGLLDVSRVQAGKLELELADDDLAATVREVVERFTIGGDGITVTGPRQLRARFDRLRLEQVVTNLLSNAVKHGGGNGIEVELSSSSARARLLVRDRGPGVPEPLKPRLFERFVRADERGASEGLGLGLWISRAIVEAHAGTIAVEDTPGGGATMIVELPRAGPRRGAPP